MHVRADTRCLPLQCHAMKTHPTTLPKDRQSGPALRDDGKLPHLAGLVCHAPTNGQHNTFFWWAAEDRGGLQTKCEQAGIPLRPSTGDDLEGKQYHHDRASKQHKSANP